MTFLERIEAGFAEDLEAAKARAKMQKDAMAKAAEMKRKLEEYIWDFMLLAKDL